MQSAKWLRRYVERRRVLGLAAEVGFWLFLSLLPLAAVGGMIAAKLVVGQGAGIDSWLGGIPGPMRQLVANELSNVAAWNGGAVGPLGALGFVWLASSGIHALFDAFEAMTFCPRTWVQKRLAALASCFFLSLGGGVLALLAIGLAWARAFVSEVPVRVGQGVGLASRLGGGGLVVLGIVAGLYAIGLERKERRVLPLLPGAVFATLLQALLAFAYALLLRATGDGSAYLAGLATVGVTMTLVYLYALSILLGLAVNQWWRIARRMRSAKRERALHTPSPP